MKRVTRNGVIAVAAASGAMAVVSVQAAFAAGGAGAAGGATGSPGLISGNTIQLPVDVPINVCGNTVNVVGLLNPAAGNACANEGAGGGAGSGKPGGASAEGGSTGSPGVVSGNGVQLPIDLPVNVSGNSVNVVGVGNPATGNESANGPGPQKPPERPVRPERPVEPERPTTPEPKPRPTPAAETPARPAPAPAAPAPAPPGTTASLAHTGTDATLPVALGAGALVLGGAALYRRHRPETARR
ncbi:chaplin family protein [Streptomyces sp. NPDC093252]|uniref:chaplin n=1 Tax=Streptomyces sp. NPDC093252 TaxID=3154980 RepID=UPI003429DE3E